MLVAAGFCWSNEYNSFFFFLYFSVVDLVHSPNTFVMIPINTIEPSTKRVNLQEMYTNAMKDTRHENLAAIFIG
jgi:hypothetical protein